MYYSYYEEEMQDAICTLQDPTSSLHDKNIAIDFMMFIAESMDIFNKNARNRYEKKISKDLKKEI